MFFPRLRKQAKWVFLFLALVFGLGFVGFGVGAGGVGVGDIFRGAGGGSGVPSIEDAEKEVAENPRDPSVDYAYYLKGLVYFNFDRNFLEKLFRVDLCERPPNEAYRSFSNFAQLVQRFPESPYSADAHQRMIFLRNCFASYETSVAQYYLERGAWVAAANRAKYAIETATGRAVSDAGYPLTTATAGTTADGRVTHAVGNVSGGPRPTQRKYSTLSADIPLLN